MCFVRACCQPGGAGGVAPRASRCSAHGDTLGTMTHVLGPCAHRRPATKIQYAKANADFLKAHPVPPSDKRRLLIFVVIPDNLISMQMSSIPTRGTTMCFVHFCILKCIKGIFRVINTQKHLLSYVSHLPVRLYIPHKDSYGGFSNHIVRMHYGLDPCIVMKLKRL